MPEKTPRDRGARLVDALIVWITPDRQLTPGLNRFEVRVSEAGRIPFRPRDATAWTVVGAAIANTRPGRPPSAGPWRGTALSDPRASAMRPSGSRQALAGATSRAGSQQQPQQRHRYGRQCGHHRADGEA